jgi:hypothetical protein
LLLSHAFPEPYGGEQGKPAMHELAMAIYDDQTITDAWAGTGELDFTDARAKNSTPSSPCAPGRVSSSPRSEQRRRLAETLPTINGGISVHLFCGESIQ